jgi:hypothetical protein
MKVYRYHTSLFPYAPCLLLFTETGAGTYQVGYVSLKFNIACHCCLSHSLILIREASNSTSTARKHNIKASLRLLITVHK